MKKMFTASLSPAASIDLLPCPSARPRPSLIPPSSSILLMFGLSINQGLGISEIPVQILVCVFCLQKLCFVRHSF